MGGGGMKRMATYIVCTMVVVAVTFIAGPSFLDLGPQSACACEKLPAKASEDWRRCAVSIFYNANEMTMLPILNRNPGRSKDGSEQVLWRNLGDASRFDNYVSRQVEPRCGTFAAAREQDLRFQLKRDLFGYERFYIPESVEESLRDDSWVKPNA
jgi:hypothetical protein